MTWVTWAAHGKPRPCNPNYVVLDLDFDSTAQAEGFLEIMRTEVWPSPEKAPAKVGTPQTRIVEMVESVEY